MNKILILGEVLFGEKRQTSPGYYFTMQKKQKKKQRKTVSSQEKACIYYNIIRYYYSIGSLLFLCYVFIISLYDRLAKK